MGEAMGDCLEEPELLSLEQLQEEGEAGIELGSGLVADASEEVALKNSIEQGLGSLSTRQRLVLEGRFGLNGQEPKTLAQLGRELGLSVETVRRHEKKALQTLKAQSWKSGLHLFIEE